MDTTTLDTPKVTPDTLRSDALGMQKRADTGMDELRQERTAETERRTTERRTDEARYQEIGKEAMAVADKGPEKVPMPNPNLGPTLDPQQTQNFAFAILAMSLVGAAAGRQNFGMAAAAMDGMLKGMKEGALEQVKERKAEFDREFKVATEKQGEANRVYEQILQSKKLSLTMQAQLIQNHAAAHQDWDMEAKARARDYDGMYARASQGMQAAARLEEYKRNFDLHMQQFLETKRHHGALEAKAGGAGAASAWTPEAIDAIAQTVYAGQPMPAMGSGAAASAARALAWKRVAEIAKEHNVPLRELPAARAQFSADKASLVKLTQTNDAIHSFERTALKNGDRLVQLADKVDTTGIPVVERWIRAGRREVAGDVDVNNFNAQIMLFGTEVAKILTNPNMSGQLTDSARQEVQEFIPSRASAPQIKGLVSLLKQDFQNRADSNQEQINEIRDRLRTIGSRDGEGAAPSAQSGGGWTDAKEKRYQELKAKLGGGDAAQ